MHSGNPEGFGMCPINWPFLLRFGGEIGRVIANWRFQRILWQGVPEKWAIMVEMGYLRSTSRELKSTPKSFFFFCFAAI
jgi:hypothetical protein